jgi:hypothetical protein
VKAGLDTSVVVRLLTGEPEIVTFEKAASGLEGTRVLGA